MRDLASNVSVEPSIAPAVQSATIVGETIDLLGSESAAFVFATGAIVGAGVFVPSIEESDTGNESPDDFDPVAAADIIGEVPDQLEASSVLKLGYTGNKRYIRAKLTKSSGTSIAAGAVVVMGNLHVKPAV